MDRFTALEEVVRTRSSVRRWSNESVPRADLERMIECARLAPSATNSQPWHFTVVTDRALIIELEAATQNRFAQLAAELEAAGRRESARKLRVFEKYAAQFGSAPAVILVSGEPYDSRFMREVFAEILSPDLRERLAQEESLKSTSLATMNLLLAAHALGYGAVPMTGPVLVIPELLKTKLLGLHTPYEPHLLIAIGRPATEHVVRVPRKPLEEICSWIA